ncbi:hypothetical protein RDV84_00895 [Lysobacter yananisis]|uniref:Lipoprotein n=1 Tax=Lysobacter yananisis TaxID=1003114 RepID=A0ABY9P8N4_9GAMM|nr:hypothetical protein [Lysobacter yananisis]WMT03442.1 hypothetical protein RDV84_00895 [Lysobacter yananisis]
MRLLASIMAIGLSGGTQAPNLDRIDWSKNSLLLIGAHANVENVAIYAFPGKMKGGAFDFHGFIPARMNSQPVDGYFLGVSKGEETIGLSSVAWYATGNLVQGASYELRFCRDRTIPVFRVEPGQIVYVTDLYLHAGSAQGGPGKWRDFRWVFRPDVDAAKAWVEKHRPGDISRFVVADVSEMPSSDKCKD